MRAVARRRCWKWQGTVKEIARLLAVEELDRDTQDLCPVEAACSAIAGAMAQEHVVLREFHRGVAVPPVGIVLEGLSVSPGLAPVP